MTKTTLAGAAVLGILALTGCSPAAPTTTDPMASASAMSSDSMHPSSSMSNDPMHSPSPSMSDSMTKGAYLSYDEYQAKMDMMGDSKVVLFFHATWCPDCKATNESLTSAGVPAGLTVVKVDYDSMGDLKKKYGVTQQHTFVQIDHMGAELAKWTGSKSGAEILTHTVSSS